MSEVTMRVCDHCLDREDLPAISDHDLHDNFDVLRGWVRIVEPNERVTDLHDKCIIPWANARREATFAVYGMPHDYESSDPNHGITTNAPLRAGRR